LCYLCVLLHASRLRPLVPTPIINHATALAAAMGGES
jgi:hypothetical protein